MRVLVTDSDSRSALAATRALGRGGNVVFTTGEHRDSLAAVSRHSAGFEYSPPPRERPDEFVAAIADCCKRLHIDVLLPMSEISTLLLTRHVGALPDTTQLPFADADAIALAADKPAIVKIAAECSVPIPKTTFIETKQDLDELSSWTGFPAVLKPSHSNVLTAQGWKSLGVRYANSLDELLSISRALPPQAFPLMIQERIRGPGAGVFTCYTNGRPLVWFAHERIREKPPSGGVSVLSRSIPPDPDAVTFAARLLERLSWRGVAMVEFKRDNRDGSLRLMEINGRFWGSLQLAIDAGVNFPQILVDIAAGRTPAAVMEYRLGLRNRWLWGDFSALLMQLTRKREHLDLPPEHPGRLRAIWDFLKFWAPGLRYEIERTSDPAPALLETKRALRALVRPDSHTH